MVGNDPAYLSFDLDCLDPVYLPETGTLLLGEFSYLEAQLMIRELGDLNLYGGDLVEVAPPFDPTENMPLTGATLMFGILCVVAQSLSRR
ncbi:MAG: arginase family protein [SAR324 cluster bacterium]|nr:arginase family protein [SAR324 cluster bacterium]